MFKRDGFLIFGSPAIEEPEIGEVLSSLRSGWLGTGPKVARFERDFKSYKETGYTPVAVNSGTAALSLSLLALELKPEDEVITTPLTFCATVNAIVHSGAKPVLADIDQDSLNIDPGEIRKRITPRTKAILPVHFAGRACAMDEIMSIARDHGLRVVEDCAHAIETEYKGEKTGIFGDFGCFSFYVTKNVVTGEGGMVLARSDRDAARIKTLALHGMSHDAWKRFGDEGFKHYQVIEAGFKYNMMDLQAALGIHQLERVEKNWKRRQEVWNLYGEAFKKLPITLPQAPEPETRHAYHLHSILIDEKRSGVTRDRFLEEMTKRNIGVGVHYLSIPEHPFYRERYGWRPEDYPKAMKVGRQTVSLPLSAKLTDSDVEDVIAAVKDSIP